MSALMPIFKRTGLHFQRGQGAWLYTPEDEAYLDFGSGIAVNALGHSHPALVKALSTQVNKLWHISNLHHCEGGEELAQRLTDLCFADQLFFTNSGAEALEGAIKVARRYHYHKNAPQRSRIITMGGAFHGRTLATIAATGNPVYLEGFGPTVQGFDQVPFNNLEAVKEAITEETAAILVEPIQGEGGIRTAQKSFLQGLRALCDQHNILLIFDEIQTGMGRTGTLFAHEDSGVSPDIMTLAKGLGNGFPIGACLATKAACDAMTPGTHGTTFGGNPLAVSVAQAVLNVMNDAPFFPTLNQNATLLWTELDNLQKDFPSVVEEIRGKGLLIGLKLSADISNKDFFEAALQENLLVVPAGENVIRLLPPLIIGKAEIDAAMTKLRNICQRF